MAREKMPFDEDVMTLIMGINGPDEPGQHGRTEVPPPDADAIAVLIKIRDMVDDFLLAAGKNAEDSEPEDKDKKEDKENEENEF